MFIIANFYVIAIALLVAVPFYFFNRYLVKKMRPKETGTRLISYFFVVFITALLYSLVAVFVMLWMGYKNK